MTEYTGEERRKYTRLPVEARVDFQIKEKRKASLARSLSALSKNVSVEGICFKTDVHLFPGETLLLDIFLPGDNKPLRIFGEVRWEKAVQSRGSHNVYETGVKLFTFNQTDENKFIEYVCDKMTERLSRFMTF